MKATIVALAALLTMAGAQAEQTQFIVAVEEVKDVPNNLDCGWDIEPGEVYLYGGPADDVHGDESLEEAKKKTPHIIVKIGQGIIVAPASAFKPCPPEKIAEAAMAHNKMVQAYRENQKRRAQEANEQQSKQAAIGHQATKQTQEFEQKYQESANEAVRLFPDLKIEGSKLRKAVEEEIQYLAEAKSSLLNQPDYPIAVACRLAELQGIEPAGEGFDARREAIERADTARKQAEAEHEFSTSYEIAVLEAGRLYPDLKVEGSEFRQSVEIEMRRLAEEGSSLLSNPNYPIVVAQNVAKSLKILSVDQKQYYLAAEETRQRQEEEEVRIPRQQAQMTAYQQEQELLLPEGDRKALERRRQDEIDRGGPMALIHSRQNAAPQSAGSQQQPGYIILPPRGPVRPGTVLRDSSGRVADTLKPGRVYHKRAVDDAEEAQILRLSQAMERGASQEELAMMATTEELQQLRTEIERLRQSISPPGVYRHY